MTNTETDAIRERMTQEELDDVYPLSIAEIDAEIARLQALKRKQNKTPRTVKPKAEKAVKHTRKIICSNCGTPDSRANMVKISKFEYAHVMCPSVKRELLVRFSFE